MDSTVMGLPWLSSRRTGAHSNLSEATPFLLFFFFALDCWSFSSPSAPSAATAAAAALLGADDGAGIRHPLSTTASISSALPKSNRSSRRMRDLPDESV